MQRRIPNRRPIVKPKNLKPFKPELEAVPALADFKPPRQFMWASNYARKGFAGLTVDDRAKLSYSLNVTLDDLTKEVLDAAFVHALICCGFTLAAIAEFCARAETRLQIDGLSERFAFALKQAEAAHVMDVSRVPFNRTRKALDVMREEDGALPLHERKEAFLMFFYLRLMAQEAYAPLVQQFQYNQWPYVERPKQDAIFTRTAFCLALIRDYRLDRDYVRFPRLTQVHKEIDAGLVLGEPWIVRSRLPVRMPDPFGKKDMHSWITVDVWRRSWLIEKGLWHGLPTAKTDRQVARTFDWFQIPVALGGKVVKFPEIRSPDEQNQTTGG